jgi:hypothetical protein
LYIASANVGLAPFTGQNIPFLGLDSGSDLLQGTALLVLVTLLFYAGSDVQMGKKMRNQRSILWAQGTVLSAFVVASMLLLSQMDFLRKEIGEASGAAIVSGEENRYTGDFNFTRKVFDALKKSLPNPRDSERTQAYYLDGERLEKMPGASPEQVVKQFVAQFNQRTEKYDEKGGVIYLRRASDSGGQGRVEVVVNEDA